MRESGYYWVKYNKKWIVGEWDGKYWSLTGSDEIFQEEGGLFDNLPSNIIKEVGEKIERRILVDFQL